MHARGLYLSIGAWGLMLAACASPGPVMRFELHGTVHFPVGRATQAGVGDVAIAATISLIDPSSDQTIATTLTNPDATFFLSAAKLQLAEGRIYYLEAVKGLSSNRAGSDAARLRNLVRYRKATGWQAIGTTDASLTLSTTALAAIAYLRAGTPEAVDPDALIGTLASGASDVFASAGTGIAPSEYDQVLALATQALTADRDPLHSFRYSPATRAYMNVMPAVPDLPAIAWLSPPGGSVGTLVAIHGVNLARGTPQVTLDGLPVALGAIADSQVAFTVPEGASTGILRLTTRVGSATTSFSVIPVVAGAVGSGPTPPPSGPGLDLRGSVSAGWAR